jgi:hygromycin-B 4-O-kinase
MQERRPHGENPGVDVRALLREEMGGEVSEPEPLSGGEFSRAFAFEAGERAYVVRVSSVGHAAESFGKDARAARLFGSASLPIPRVVAAGAFEGGQFCISERAAGRRVMELTRDEQIALLPALLDTLDQVGCADVGGTYGYGAWDVEGRGAFSSWHACLADAIEDRREGYYQNWHELFRTTFLEREVYETVYRRMMELAAACPEERALIHNDYHFDNVLTDGRRVTAVIDWGNAGYGDRLYDAAWVAWVFDKDYGIDAATPLRERLGGLPGYETRIACYTFSIGLDDMRFFAKTGRQAQYESARARLLELAYQ